MIQSPEHKQQDKQQNNFICDPQKHHLAGFNLLKVIKKTKNENI